MLKTPYIGFPPFLAIPEIIATACSSAIPTSINCFANFSLLSLVNPKTVGVPEVITATVESFSILSIKNSAVSLLNPPEYELRFSPVSGSKGIP